MTVGQAFDQSVEYYDDWVKIALPSYERIFSVALDLIPFETDAAIDVLDLGAGTGLFSQHVQSKYSQASFELYDIAPKMLDVAKIRFQESPNRFQFVAMDYRFMQNTRQYDLVISSLSIHHLEDSEKRSLFGRLYSALREGGAFINIDQIKGPTPSVQDMYWLKWLRMVRQRGAAEDQIRASIKRRRDYDKDAFLVDQLMWLTDAGFAGVDCVYKDYFVGVFYAWKEP